ncbi:glycosyltransferase [Halorubrum rubrum]|uniref:Glycosyltransferase n=1 Tax=Halorubrum rubrum TaxID=1126240 RepID=A0ABD5R002_9EURY|nr:glycosyltransferase [Halorubrum rubrum]
MNSTTPRTSVSIIIPVYNDPAGVRIAVDALVDQTYPSSQYEVVIVDNDSTDATLEVARTAAATNSELFRVERETDVQSSYAARNTGIEASEGEVVGFLDADVVPDGDWIESTVSAMVDRDIAYAGCRVDVECSKSTYSGRYNAATGFPIERYISELDFAPTCALFVDRDVIRDVGPFDEGLVSSGDLEFGRRVAAAGWKQGYVHEARAVHPARSSLRSLLRKYFRLGRGDTQLSRRHPERFESSALSCVIGLLPAHPLCFPNYFDAQWDQYPAIDWVALYVLSSLVGVARVLGRVVEHVD